MSDYNRTTRECAVNQLHPELRQAIRSYFKEHELGELETETQICCETISERKEFGRFVSMFKGDLDATIHTGMILTSEWLIWARSGEKSGTVLNAANLKEIQVRAYQSIFTRDAGLEIIGYIGAASGSVRGYIGMGADPSAQKFCEEVEKAVTKLKPPPAKRNLPKWLGGE
jgi:hypothetical protein